ncbi:Wzy polymerase domain-containing protein, partial [Idiomarina abyssalis]|uniref:PglL family O-oligosaccharyltransferase n=1 Tax=Idiomarina abyssalis TaxID=86102 RepID=UPI003A91194C
LNALISFLQILPGRILLGVIPHPLEAHAAGVFMQANILASCMATTIILAFYQISSPSFSNRVVPIRALCFISIFTASAILISTGSRIGILGILVGFPLIIISRYAFFKRKKIVFSTAVITLLSGFMAGLALSDGVLKAYSKIEKLASTGSEIRLHIYQVSLDFFSEKPLFGHGVGSFNSKFHEYASAYIQDLGGNPLLGFSKFTHPHNEVLLWAIEGGTVALLGLILIAAAIVLQAKKIGFQRGGAYISILTPILLHTQTELPFYSSNYHWLIFIFILYLIFKPFNKKTKIGASSYLFPLFGSIIFILAIYCLSSTLKVSRDINGYILFNETTEADLKSAESNLYFGPLATQINKRISLYNDLNNGTKSGTISFITWAEQNIENSPPPLVFHDLALAYNHVGMKVRALKTIKKGLLLYPRHPVILRAQSIIKEHQESAIEKVLDDIILPNKSTVPYPMSMP